MFDMNTWSSVPNIFLYWDFFSNNYLHIEVHGCNTGKFLFKVWINWRPLHLKLDEWKQSSAINQLFVLSNSYAFKNKMILKFDFQNVTVILRLWLLKKFGLKIWLVKCTKLPPALFSIILYNFCWTGGLRIIEFEEQRDENSLYWTNLDRTSLNIVHK